MSAPTVRRFGSISNVFNTTYGAGNTALQAPVNFLGNHFTSGDSTVLTGSTMVVYIGLPSALWTSQTVTAVADNTGVNTYVNKGNGWWMATSITGTTAYLATATCSGHGTYPVFYVWEVQGSSTTASAFEQSAVASAATESTPTVTGFTTKYNNDLILCALSMTVPNAGGSNGPVVGPGGSFTQDNNYSTSSSVGQYTPCSYAFTGYNEWYGGAQHLGVSGIFSGTNITMPITSLGLGYSAWVMSVAAISPPSASTSQAGAFLVGP